MILITIYHGQVPSSRGFGIRSLRRREPGTVPATLRALPLLRRSHEGIVGPVWVEEAAKGWINIEMTETQRSGA